MFKFTSTKLAANLEALRQQYVGKNLSAKVVVPPELSWWYYQEFGTVGPYSIRGVVLPATPEYPEAKGFPEVHHPGVPARHFVRDSLQRIREESASTMVTALHGGDYAYSAANEVLFSTIMVNVIDTIAESMGQVLHQKGYEGSKLGGQQPEDVFKESATIIDSSED